jgi:precorrin-6Y C5,15-methyltransferase (decarboxylating)
VKRPAVTVIGIGDDGCVGLSSQAVGAIAQAQVLAGGERQLAFFPQFDGKKILLQSELSKAVAEIADLSLENTVCVLASGDPLFYGVGNLLVKKIGAEHLEFIPAPSSIQQAFARAKIKWDDAEVISLHGRPIRGLVNQLQGMKKVALLTDPENSPPRIAQYLLSFEEKDWAATVCENLGGKGERVRKFSDLDLLAKETGISDLNVMILERTDLNWKQAPVIPFGTEESFAKRMPKNGLITKREVRVLSLAALDLRSESIVWDIGAGSGSVAIEAAKIARGGWVYAVEVDPEGVALCRENVVSHRTDNVEVVSGRAPEILAELKDPDAVFYWGIEREHGGNH